MVEDELARGPEGGSSIEINACLSRISDNAKAVGLEHVSRRIDAAIATGEFDDEEPLVHSARRIAEFMSDEDRHSVMLFEGPIRGLDHEQVNRLYGLVGARPPGREKRTIDNKDEPESTPTNLGKDSLIIEGVGDSRGRPNVGEPDYHLYVRLWKQLNKPTGELPEGFRFWP